MYALFAYLCYGSVAIIIFLFFQCGDQLWTAKSAVYRHQNLTLKGLVAGSVQIPLRDALPIITLSPAFSPDTPVFASSFSCHYNTVFQNKLLPTLNYCSHSLVVVVVIAIVEHLYYNYAFSSLHLSTADCPAVVNIHCYI